MMCKVCDAEGQIGTRSFYGEESYPAIVENEAMKLGATPASPTEWVFPDGGSIQVGPGGFTPWPICH